MLPSTARCAAKDGATRKAAFERASLLTPVAKAFSTDIGIEVASLGVQVHGGMGFIEETGAAQHYRDARIAAIYEGTNGIQALDLVTRKVPLEGGKTIALYLDELRATVAAVKASNAPAFGETAARLAEAIDSLERATQWLLAQKGSQAALAGATPYLRLFGNAAGGCLLAEQALAALRDGGDDAGRTALARFFAENVAVQATGPGDERHRGRRQHPAGGRGAGGVKKSSFRGARASMRTRNPYSRWFKFP